MNLLMDDIRTYKEFAIKGCREVVFSHGGAFFAAVNSNTVQIYNTYTCDNVGNLRGHNGKVNDPNPNPNPKCEDSPSGALWNLLPRTVRDCELGKPFHQQGSIGEPLY